MASTDGADQLQQSLQEKQHDANQGGVTSSQDATSSTNSASGAKDAGEWSGEASPAPSSPASGLSSTKGGTSTPSVSAHTNPPPLSMPHPKKFSHVNINKKFLEKTSASTPSHTSAASPVTKTASASQKPVLQSAPSHSRLVTAKLTATPQPSIAGPGWSRPSSAVPSTAPTPLPAASNKASPGPNATAGGPALLSPQPVGKAIQQQSRPSQDAAPQRREATARPVWGGAKGAVVPSPKIDSAKADFPTAAEVAQGRVTKPSEKKVAPDAAAAHKQAELQAEEDTFRGVHLDPNAHHWDEMEEDDDNFLGGVIEFGDGRQYNVQSNDQPPQDSKQAPPQGAEGSAHSGLTDQPVSKEERFADDFDRSWPRSRPIQQAPGQHRDQGAEGPPPIPSTSSRSPQESSRVLFNERSNRLEPYSHQRHGAPASTFNRRGSRSDHTTSPIEPRRDAPPHTHLPPVQLLQKGPHADVPPFSRAPGDRPPVSPHDGPRFRDRQPYQRDHPAWQSGGHHGSDRHSGGFGPPYPLRDAPSEDRTHRPPGFEPPPAPGGDHRRQLPPHLSATGPRHPLPVRTEGPVQPPIPSAPPVQREPSVPSASSQAAISPATADKALPATTMPIVDMEEVRKAAMHSAAERARLRRQQEEEEREKERERARRKAAELEEKMRAMEQEKAREREKAEAEKKRTEAEVVGLIEEAVSSVAPAESKVGAVERSSQRPSEPRPPFERNASSRGTARPFSTRRTSFTPPTLPANTSSASETESWRRKNTAPSIQAESQMPRSTPVLPPPIFANSSLEIKADEDVEVFDFSDHGKLAGVENEPSQAPAPSGRPARAVASDFFGDATSQRVPPQHARAEEESWRRVAPIGPSAPAASTEEDKAGLHTGHSVPVQQHAAIPNGLQTTTIPNPPVHDDHTRRVSSHHQNGVPRPPVGSSYREAPMSTLNDTLSRIKGALDGMHHDTEPPKPQKWLPPALRAKPTHPDFSPPQEVFDVTAAEPPKSPKPAWNVVHVKLPHVSRPVAASPKMELVWPRGQRHLRLDAYSFNPPIDILARRDTSINDVIFSRPRILRGQPKYYVSIPRRRINRRPPTSDPSASPVVNIPSTPTRVRGPSLPKDPGPSTSSSWRKAPTVPAAHASTCWHPQNDDVKEATELDTVSRSPPPEAPSAKPSAPSLPKTSQNSAAAPMAASRSKTEPKMPAGSDVAFYRNSRVETAVESQPPVQFFVSSELEGESGSQSDVQGMPNTQSKSTAVSTENAPASSSSERHPEQQVAIALPSVNGTTTPPSSSQPTLSTWSKSPKGFSLKESPARAPDPEHLKAVWSQTSDKAQNQPVNSLKGIADDLTGVPFSLQDVKSDDGETPPPSGSGPWSRMSSHEVTRAFQQVPSPSQRPAPIAPSVSTSTNGSTSRHPGFAFSPPPMNQPAVRPAYSPYSPMVSHSPAPPVMYSHPSPVPRHMVPNGSAPVYGQAVWMPGTAPPSAGMVRSPYPPQFMPYPSPGGTMPMYPQPMPMQAAPQQNGVQARPPSMAMISPVMQPAMSPMYAGSPVLVQTTPVMAPGQVYPMPAQTNRAPMRPYEQNPTSGGHMQPSPMRQPPQNGYNPIPSNYARSPW
ncbi:hypothetical protein BV20DRAFT_987685 [Pilatotrama ljubarskyi]|nr:hypothetical protein BV20DRAFT_987685 [Pilatotrama ljubarskyi]